MRSQRRHLCKNNKKKVIQYESVNRVASNSPRLHSRTWVGRYSRTLPPPEPKTSSPSEKWIFIQTRRICVAQQNMLIHWLLSGPSSFGSTATFSRSAGNFIDTWDALLTDIRSPRCDTLPNFKTVYGGYINCFWTSSALAPSVLCEPTPHCLKIIVWLGKRGGPGTTHPKVCACVSCAKGFSNFFRRLPPSSL